MLKSVKDQSGDNHSCMDSGRAELARRILEMLAGYTICARD